MTGLSRGIVYIVKATNSTTSTINATEIRIDNMSLFLLGEKKVNLKNVLKATKDGMNLNRVIRMMASKDCYPTLAEDLKLCGINSADELTLKNVKSLVAPELKKVEKVKADDGTEREVEVLCTVRRVFETEEVQLYRDGMPLCKAGKPLTQKRAKEDEDGEKVVKEYKLCKVSAWSIGLLMNLLAQSKAANEERARIAAMQAAK